MLVKVNLVLLPVMAMMLGAALITLRRTADRTALDETHQTARLIVAAGQATFDYTVEQIKPVLEAKYDFLAQSISSYAATETIGRLGPQFRDYRYHVAALNPTNPRDLADPWEAMAIRTLGAEANRPDMVELREIQGNRFETIATPIRITNEGCLACHSTPDAAPKLMTDTYGNTNGFGWHLNEVIAAQVVSIPVAVAQRRADSIFGKIATMLVVEFVLFLLLANGITYFFARPRQLASVDREDRRL